MSEKSSFFEELKRRTVYKVATGGKRTVPEGFRYCSLCNSVLSKAMTTITCKIPDEVSAHLDAAARQRRVPKSQIIREALAASFGKRSPPVSAFDLIKDACGIIKGGLKITPAMPDTESFWRAMSDVLIDTGPLVAMLCAGDQDHAWTVEQFRALPPPFLTCEAVIAEACFLIERRGVSGAVILKGSRTVCCVSLWKSTITALRLKS